MTYQGIALHEDEESLLSEVQERLSKIREELAKDRSLTPGEIDDLGKVAHSLHVSLTQRGIEVKHHNYMLKNRGTDPDEPEFYQHIHPVEDLLAFIDDPSSNDDPEDVTVGQEFTVGIYSRRWGHKNSFSFTRSSSGWDISNLGESISTGPDGRVGGKPGSGLLSLLNQDFINYPEDLSSYLEWIWRLAAEEGLTVEELREGIESIAEWINTVEKSTPGGVFAGYN